MPAMVHSLNFCQPWAAKRKPSTMRRAVRAVVVSRDWFMGFTVSDVGRSWTIASRGRIAAESLNTQVLIKIG
ncbi:hypothetical protein ARTHROSP310_13940 [Arthrobacter sp. AD-310]